MSRSSVTLSSKAPSLNEACTRTVSSESRLQQLIDQADAGSAGASQELFAALYAELHRLADRELRRVGPQLSLGTTPAATRPSFRSSPMRSTS